MGIGNFKKISLFCIFVGLFIVLIFIYSPYSFAEKKITLDETSQVFVGEVNMKNLKKLSKDTLTSFEIPYMTKDLKKLGKLKINPAAIMSGKGFPLPQEAELVPSPMIATQQNGFNGLPQSGFIPPDVQVAAGPNHIVEIVNSAGRISDKTGMTIQDFTLAAFFLTGLDEPVDPKIIYDPINGRWFASALVRDISSVRIAVSDTNDPAGSWIVYNIGYGGSTCPDQPKIGTSDDKFVLASNLFSGFCTGGFIGTHFFVFDKSEMFLGTIVNFQQFGPDDTRFSITPAEPLNTTSDLYLVSVLPFNDNQVELYTISGAVPISTLNIASLPIQTSSAPPNAQQQGTANIIDTGDMRIQDAAFFQGKIWLSFNDSCLLTGDTQTRSCVHLVQIDTGSPSVTQDIRFGAVGSYYYYPAVSIDQFGGLGVVFGFSDASTYPSIAATGQAAGSSPNTIENPITIKLGSGVNPTDRHGDYFEAATDPANPTIIWIGGQYHASPWSTWIDSINVSDTDEDEVINLDDNCPDDFNPGQEDADNDGLGDACDPTPGGPSQSIQSSGLSFLELYYDCPPFSNETILSDFNGGRVLRPQITHYSNIIDQVDGSVLVADGSNFTSCVPPELLISSTLSTIPGDDVTISFLKNDSTEVVVLGEVREILRNTSDEIDILEISLRDQISRGVGNLVIGFGDAVVTSPFQSIHSP